VINVHLASARPDHPIQRGRQRGDQRLDFRFRRFGAWDSTEPARRLAVFEVPLLRSVLEASLVILRDERPLFAIRGVYASLASGDRSSQRELASSQERSEGGSVTINPSFYDSSHTVGWRAGSVWC
jgi:hypothetical protein